MVLKQKETIIKADFQPLKTSTTFRISIYLSTTDATVIVNNLKVLWLLWWHFYPNQEAMGSVGTFWIVVRLEVSMFESAAYFGAG